MAATLTKSEVKGIRQRVLARNLEATARKTFAKYPDLTLESMGASGELVVGFPDGITATVTIVMGDA